MIRRLILLTLLYGLVLSSRAQDGPGGMAGAALRMGFDARSIGAGNAMTSVVLPDNASVYNPALLPYVSSRNAHLGAALLPLDRSLFHISYSTPLPPSAGLAFSAFGARVGDIQGRDINGRPTEIYTTNEYALALSFGLQPAPGFTIGASAKLLHARLFPDVNSTTLGLDFGASYLVSEGLVIAVAARDVNSKYRWDSTPVYGRNGNNTVDRFPARFILGASWAPHTVPLTVSAEGESMAGLLLFRGGITYALHEQVTLRAGADGFDPTGTVGTRLMAGFSFEHVGIAWDPSFDYAFMIEPIVHAGTHVLTIRVHFSE